MSAYEAASLANQDLFVHPAFLTMGLSNFTIEIPPKHGSVFFFNHQRGRGIFHLLKFLKAENLKDANNVAL